MENSSFQFTYRTFDEIYRETSKILELSLIEQILIVGIIILSILIVFYLIPIISTMRKIYLANKERNNKKLLLTQIMLQKKVEEEIEKELEKEKEEEINRRLSMKNSAESEK